MAYSVTSDALAVSVASVAGNRIVRLNQNPTDHGLHEYHGYEYQFPRIMDQFGVIRAIRGARVPPSLI